MQHIKIIIALLSICFLAPTGIQAQGGELNPGGIDVEKSFNARLKDTEKVNVNPKLPELKGTIKKQYYSVIGKPVSVNYLPPKIRPRAFKKGGVQDAYKGYLRVGGGIPNALLGDFSYNLISKKKLNLGLDLSHYSINNSRKTENQRSSDTKALIDGTYYMKEGYAINGQIGFQNKQVYYYGYNDLNAEFDSTYSFEAENVKQRFGTFFGKATIFNGERTELDFNYSAGIDFYIMQDFYAAREKGFKLELAATKWFNETNPLEIKLITDFTNYKNFEKQTLNNFSLIPAYTYHADRFKVKLGVQMTSHEDNFQFFPDIEANASIVDGVVTIFAGANGGLYKNNFRNLSNYNPYIESNVAIKNSSNIGFYGGVKGKIQSVEYNAQVGYKNVDNLALFSLSDYRDSIPRFNVLYDTASIFTIQADVSLPLFKGLDLTGSVINNIYTLENNEKAWHLPAFTVKAGAKYRTMKDQVLVKADFFLENGVPYMAEDGTAQTLNALFDISVGAEYFFSKNIGAFIQLNNLANNRRQRWHRYPVVGLNALFGISARF